MTDHLKHIIVAQLEASLAMLNDCIRKCPPEHWDGLIAKYPFWQVAYHTLCFVDCYLSPSDAAFQPRTQNFHPQGMNELNEEYPSRRFTQTELLAYLQICREKLTHSLTTETRESLEGPSGFPRLRFSRAELHLYNLRHVQHHTGQLSACLRRIGVDTDWVSSGAKRG